MAYWNCHKILKFVENVFLSTIADDNEKKMSFRLIRDGLSKVFINWMGRSGTYHFLILFPSSAVALFAQKVV